MKNTLKENQKGNTKPDKAFKHQKNCKIIKLKQTLEFVSRLSHHRRIIIKCYNMHPINFQKHEYRMKATFASTTCGWIGFLVYKARFVGNKD